MMFHPPTKESKLLLTNQLAPASRLIPKNAPDWVRFKLMCNKLYAEAINFNNREVEKTMSMSDEALLNRLNEHPELRSRVESILLVVEDERGNLQEADAAELMLIEEMRRMGQDSLQAWANSQIIKTSQRVAQKGIVWREGKKNSSGTVHLEISQ